MATKRLDTGLVIKNDRVVENKYATSIPVTKKLRELTIINNGIKR